VLFVLFCRIAGARAAMANLRNSTMAVHPIRPPSRESALRRVSLYSRYRKNWNL